MPSLKYQLRLILATISSEAQRVSFRKVKERYYLLKRICESPKSLAKVCRSEGTSRVWFYKWARRLKKQKSLNALFDQSRKPHKSPMKTRRRIEKKVIKLRRVQPYLGAERIQDDLRRIYNEECAVSTINNILRRNNLIGKDKARKLTKKHLGKIKQPLPGYLQMDFKYVPYLVGSKQYYQLSCVDHLTSWRHIRVYPEKSTDYVLIFLKDLKDKVPFPIIEIQTDNDAAFTDKYTSKLGKPTGLHDVDVWCSKNEIRHKLIPLGEKELNGKVENTHKQDDREFFSQVRCIDERSLMLNSIGYNQRWNESRRTKRLGFKTPKESILNAYAVIIAWFGLLKEHYCPEAQPLVKLSSSGDVYIEIKQTKARKSKIKTSRKSKSSRIKDYLIWGDKKKVS
jgi:transposase InsO family protein